MLLPNDAALPLIKELLASNKTVTIPVKGTSMRPFYVDGKTQVTLSLPLPQFRRLDVVLFERENGQMVLHRIVKIQKDVLVIQGDALTNQDFVKPNQVVGVVLRHDRNGKVHSGRGFWYLTLVRVWVLLSFARRPLLGLFRRLGR
jgi:hypothetical protein